MSEAEAAKFPASQVSVAKMYYTLCMEPGCGALDDYAETRPDAEKNRRKHIAWHRRGGEDYDPMKRGNVSAQRWKTGDGVPLEQVKPNDHMVLPGTRDRAGS
jgi:hypothetical protein